MQISFIPNSANIYKNNGCTAPKSISYGMSFPKTGLSQDTFVKSPSFTGPDAFTVEWYKKLTPYNKAVINEMANDHIYRNKDYLLYDRAFNGALKYHNTAANCIKDTLNERYGEGNYVVVPIGRSLSSVCKCLGYKIGEDKIKPLPMSGAGRFQNLEECDEDLDYLKKYLESIGLSKNEVKNSNKQYIFVDYCSTGGSLRGVKNLFESANMWGPLDNVHFEDVFNLLPPPQPDKNFEDVPSEMFWKNFESDLLHCRYKEYAVVNECRWVENLKDAVPNPENFPFEKQVFLWKLLENEMNKQEK